MARCRTRAAPRLAVRARARDVRLTPQCVLPDQLADDDDDDAGQRIAVNARMFDVASANDDGW